MDCAVPAIRDSHNTPGAPILRKPDFFETPTARGSHEECIFVLLVYGFLQTGDIKWRIL